MSDRVTIKSIAQDLGISHMTVSRALTSHPNVSAETRKAVLTRAEELGYVKSAAAKAMRGDGTRIVGLLLPNLVNEFYARFADTLAAACEDKALHLIIHLTNDEPSKESRALLRLREVQAGAVIMVPVPDAAEAASRDIGNLRVVQLIRERPADRGASALLVGDGPAISDAVDHLVSVGHSLIAYIGADPAMSSGRHRLAAFSDAMKRNDRPLEPDLTRMAPPSFDMGYQSLQSLMEGGRATALVCGGFEISNGALEACLQNGLKMPQDIAFVGYGDPAHYAWINQGISTISLPVDRLARQAADVLEASMADVGHSASTITFPAAFVRRHSA
ncbi:MAG: LacI family transcriptional regulator [Alphaproteobacteria bacterium]|nr:LacI family transcriptional regulator [Alphaproteobacteria bacterium]